MKSNLSPGVLAACLLSCSAAASAQADRDPATTVLERISVTGERERGRGVLGSGAEPREAPVDVRVLSPAVLLAPGNASLSALLSRDASVQDNYATSGYYQNFTIRGYTLDLGSAYRINGFVVPAEFDIPTANMAAVQILEGIAGVQGGSVGAGGSIDFQTRRPGEPGALRLELGPRGGRAVSMDGDVVSTAAGGLAVRLNASHADLRPEQPRASGHRDLVTLAADARLAPNLLLQADVIAQRRTQPAVPGFQLLGGTTLPDLSVRDLNINRQPWSRPVVNRGVMASLHLDGELAPDLRLEGGVAQTVVRIDDNLATPTGCNSAPVQYFCSNGDYVLYDYHAGERRTGSHAYATLHAVLRHGDVEHALAFGVERIGRTVRQSDLFSATTYDDAGDALTGNLGSTAVPLPQPVGVGTDLPRLRSTQTATFVSDRLRVGPVEVLGGLRFARIAQQPASLTTSRALPQAAVTWRLQPHQRLYISYAEGLQFGSEAPLTAVNAGALLPPRSTRQLELGWKTETASGAQLGIAAFRMRRPYEFTLPQGSSYAGLGDFVRAGAQTHTGVSLHGQTSPGAAFRLEGSAAFLRARADGTGVPGYDGTQVQNVPRLAGFLQATVALPRLPIDAVVSSTQRSRRNARRDGAASVPGYAVVDTGFDWRGKAFGRDTVVALRLRNAFDRRYWRDAGEAYSADLLFPGEARSLAVSGQIAF